MVDTTSYGLNPGVESNAFTQNIINGSEQPQQKKEEADRIMGRWDQMDSAAINWKLHWQRCYQYIVPRKEDVIAVRMPGDDRESDIYDTTAVLANEQLGSALHSMLTNPETRFFELLFGDPALDENSAVKEWCQETGDRMYQVLNSSNFQTEIYEMYIDLTAAGTGHLYMEEDDEYIVRFSARALKEVRIDENAMGLVDVTYRVFKLRPFQILQMFPELKELPNDIQMAADKNAADQIEIIHAVEPIEDVRDQSHAGKTKAKGHKFSSTYMLKDKRFILSQSSYEEFPYCSPRWSKTTGELYGRGPGMQMLPDIQMLNAMMLTVIQGAQKTVDPPLMVEDDSVIGQVRLTPGGLTTVRPGSEPLRPLITNAQVEFGEKMLDSIRGRIRAGFYVDQLQLPKESPQRTAEEVRQIAEEQMRLMGPILGRQHFELLRPLITRLFGIMWRKGKVDAPPQILKGKKMEVKYSSLIARAQKMQEAQNMVRAFQTIQPMVQIFPEVRDVLRIEDATRSIWDLYGNPAKLLYDEEEVERKRKIQQQQALKLQEQQEELHKSEVAKNNAPMVSAVGQLAQAQQPQSQGQ
jgi:hypothetical protein